MTDYLDAGATISHCGRYRYLLWREWRGSHGEHWRWLGAKDGDGKPIGEPKACLFVMLNPSTADAQNDDPTIRRCVGFAKAWGYDRLEVVNLFAYRASSPADLLALSAEDDPVGPENQDYVEEAAERAGVIVCAWGGNGCHLGQDETVLGWLDRAAHCLPPRLRVPFVMAHTHEMPRAKIAAALHISERQVEKRMTKALRACRRRLLSMGVDLEKRRE